MKPFTTKEFSKLSLLNKMFNKDPEINFKIEINNRLCSVEFESLTLMSIDDLKEKYKIGRFNNRVIGYLQDLLVEFLNHHLLNPVSTTNDYSSSKILQTYLQLEDEIFWRTYIQVAEMKFTNLIGEMLKDKVISDDEEKILEEWKLKLNVSDERFSAIFQSMGQAIVNSLIEQIIMDGKISPDEEMQLTNLITGLKTELVIDEKSKAVLDRMKRFWRIENEELSPIAIDIFLPKNELCFYVADVDIYETRRVIKSLSYGGPAIRVKIMKGVYYRAGNLALRPQSEDELSHIDSGKLYITNKRLLFVGAKQNKPIPLNKIIDFNVYKNGLEVSKDTGKSPFYKMGQDADIAGAYLARCLKDTMT